MAELTEAQRAALARMAGGSIPAPPRPTDGANIYTPQNAHMFDAGATSPGVNVMDPVPGVPMGARLEAVADNVVGLNNGVMSPGERAGALINKAGESMTLGLAGDETSAALESLIPGVDYETRRDHYRANEAQIERENPGLSLAADVGGALVAPLGAVSAMGQGMRLLPRMAASAATTGAMSGTYGFMEGEGGAANRTNEAVGAGALGAGVGAAIPLAGAGVQRVADALQRGRTVRQVTRAAPTTEQLRQQARQAYAAVDDAGVQITPQSFDDLSSQLRQTARGAGMDELPGPGSLTPQSARVMQITDEMGAGMAQEPTAALPFSSLDQLRRHAGTAAGNMSNRTDSAVGTQMVGAIDDYVNRLTPDDLAGGDPEALKSAIGRARELWSRMSRSQTIDTAIEQSENYLGGQASGLRNQFARILRSDKLNRGFSDAEKAMMRRVVNGSVPQQLLNLMGGGIGQLATIGVGAGLGSAGGIPGSIAGSAVGAGIAGLARRGSEAMTNRQAEIVRALIAAGGVTDDMTRANPAIGRITERLLRQGTAGVSGQAAPR